MTSSSDNQQAGTYRLTAIGDLQSETKEVPRLRSILFIASNGSENHTWMTPNRGTFVADFSFLVDAGTAHTLYQRICRGETVTFPGLFGLAVLKERLGG
jgi:hypothetical protein